jgi:EAL domain-containing protein (putative c-di-GMP-specific phosphodiesterase class I)
MDVVKDVRPRARDLRALGFRLAIDDLGAGYAGLTSFATLEPEIVKLDMSLVRDVHAEPIKERLVESIVSLCRGLSMKVVAEGIETVEELDAVRRLGCDYGQGYCLARPSAIFELLDRE